MLCFIPAGCDFSDWNHMLLENWSGFCYYHCRSGSTDYWGAKTTEVVCKASEEALQGNEGPCKEAPQENHWSYQRAHCKV